MVAYSLLLLLLNVLPTSGGSADRFTNSGPTAIAYPTNACGVAKPKSKTGGLLSLDECP